MSATASTTTTKTLDTSQTSKVPFFRLVSVEYRKMIDTRSGIWLLGITFGMLAVITAILLLVMTLADVSNLTASMISDQMVLPLSLLVPVMAILIVTSEWSQRTHLVTFALEPQRGRVISAKLMVVALLGLSTIVAAVALGSLTNMLQGPLTDSAPVWDLDFSSLAWLTGQQVMWFLMAFGLAMLLLNTPGAVAIFYFFGLIAPLMVYAPLYLFSETARAILPWVDLTISSSPFISGADLMGTPVEIGGLEWLQLGSATTLWVVAPIVFGAMRVIRAEVK